MRIITSSGSSSGELLSELLVLAQFLALLLEPGDVVVLMHADHVSNICLFRHFLPLHFVLELCRAESALSFT
jgi:selenocysteine lyase/cysteine desulfurase